MWRVQTLQHRGAEAARAGGVDRTAPVQARAAVDIPAPAALVWGVLSEVEAWPAFVPGVRRAQVQGPPGVRPGQRFTWTNGGVPIRSRVEVATPGVELTWTGVALWLVAVHRNTVEDLPGGGCRLVSSESMAGMGAAQLMPARTLERQLAGFVAAMRHEAVRRGGVHG